MLQTQQIASFKNIFPGKHAAERPQNILLNVINHAPGYATRRKQLHSMQPMPSLSIALKVLFKMAAIKLRSHICNTIVPL